MVDHVMLYHKTFCAIRNTDTFTTDKKNTLKYTTKFMFQLLQCLCYWLVSVLVIVMIDDVKNTNNVESWLLQGLFHTVPICIIVIRVNIMLKIP